MNDFWDAVLFRVFFGLTEDCFHAGRHAAGRILQTAGSLGLVSVAECNDLSLFVLLLGSPPDCSLHQAALAEHTARRLTPLGEWGVLREALPPRLTELLLLHYFGQSRQQALIRRALRTAFLPSLAVFMARLLLCDYARVQAFATTFVWNVTRTLRVDEIAREGFLPHLYRAVLGVLGGPPAAWPSTPIPWRDRLNSDEHRFLDCCLGVLSPEQRCLLFLSFYGQLNPLQITHVLSERIPRAREKDVVDWLEAAWDKVLRCLPGRPR